MLYCIVVSKDIEYINHEFREEAIRKWVHHDLVPIQFAGIKLNNLSTVNENCFYKKLRIWMSKFCSIFLVGLGLAIYTETGIF